MNRKLWAKVKRKQRLWERMKKLKQENGSDREYLETDKNYRRLNNQIRWETWNALKLKEKQIASLVKENPKVSYLDSYLDEA
ncbi:hypothetical protein E2C01_033769 [Portunus trituberculatus]|uniref:Uncharacterized protein n=1 Tax=Portunus trituberculatus TaxID=210409 RepID=A0A5B7F523_PORTR|nr:hypothetical protein [Portunus trituberculatus]